MILFETSLSILLIAFWVTQIVAPVIRNSPILPMFRKEARLLHQEKLLEQATIEAELAVKLKEKANKLRQYAAEHREDK